MSVASAYQLHRHRGVSTSIRALNFARLPRGTVLISLAWHTLNLIYDIEHGKKRSGYRDFGNRSSLELLATEIDSGPRRSRAKLCALIDVETPLAHL